ncbi:MAG: hypothetical protein KDD37_04835 [Bdellovibrionales bacterium]|nr:hypothetical protein [Bdellovibrionales bacterium]
MSKLTTKQGIATLECINIADESKQEVSSKLVSIAGQKKGSAEDEAIYYYVLASKITPEDFQKMEPQMRRKFLEEKNPEYKLAFQFSLAGVYERTNNIKGLEILYKAGDLYEGSDWDSRMQVLSAAGRLEERSELLTKNAIEMTRKLYDSENYYQTVDLVGLFKTDADVAELRKILDTKPREQALSYFTNIDYKNVHIAPKVIDIYLDKVLDVNEEAYFLSEDIIPHLNEAQKNRLRAFAKEYPERGLSMQVREKLIEGNN